MKILLKDYKFTGLQGLAIVVQLVNLQARKLNNSF